VLYGGALRIFLNAYNSHQLLLLYANLLKIIGCLINSMHFISKEMSDPKNRNLGKSNGRSLPKSLLVRRCSPP
jgi:hypothetical protein